MNIKPLLFTASAALTLLLASCSGVPGISDVESTLEPIITSQSEGNIELVEIEKTNSEEKEIFGQKVYNIDYKATIQFKKDCFIYVNKSGMGPLFESFKTYDQEPDFVPNFAMVVTSCKKGDKVSYNDRISFRDTEEGWVAN